MQIPEHNSNCIGNVIRIIDNRTILVNTGNDILHVDDHIQVYELGPEITNYDGTSLGNYEFIKDTLKVISTNKNYSVCQKQDSRTIYKSATISQLALSPLFEDKVATEYIPLNIDENDIQPLTITDPLIRIGDPIKLAIGKSKKPA